MPHHQPEHRQRHAVHHHNRRLFVHHQQQHRYGRHPNAEPRHAEDQRPREHDACHYERLLYQRRFQSPLALPRPRDALPGIRCLGCAAPDALPRTRYRERAAIPTELPAPPVPPCNARCQPQLPRSPAHKVSRWETGKDRHKWRCHSRALRQTRRCPAYAPRSMRPRPLSPNRRAALSVIR